MKKGSFLGFLLLVVAFAMTACSEYQKILKSNDFSYKLKMGKKYYAEKQYDKAEELLQSVLPAYKGTEQYRDIYLLYCMCSYYQQDYGNAQKLFHEYLDNNQGVADSVREQLSFLKSYAAYQQILSYQLDQENTNNALVELISFISEFPNSDKKKEAMELISKCRQQLEEKDFYISYLYYQIEQYKAANIMFTEMVDRYSISDFIDKYDYYKILSMYKYANKSITARKEQRYRDLLAECLLFEQQYANSKYFKEVKRIENQSQEYLNKLLKSLEYEHSTKKIKQ
ncbi:MAG: outer membrane protein assembly factor BamD [Chitinophagaceae bacterium]